MQSINSPVRPDSLQVYHVCRLISFLDFQSQASSTQAQIDLLTTELQTIAQANSTLSTISDNTIPAMALQLNTFEEIWNAVTADMGQLIVFVNTAQKIGAFDPYLAYEILRTQSSPLYTALSSAMLAVSNYFVEYVGTKCLSYSM
jgi:hypothetical protein